MPLAVRLRSVVSLLGRFPALAGVDLDVAPGEVVLVAGPNGAGKTTLLRACAGIVGIASGEITVLGCDLRTHRRGVRRRVGFVGHGSSLYEDLSVAENVRFAVRAAGRSAAEAAECSEAALERLGLAGRLRDVSVARLSAGQRRRTTLATVVARRPELWLLDEPHAGLDGAGRDVLDAIVTEAAARGATVMMASHELERASGLAGRVVVMAGGRLTDGIIEGDQAAPGAQPGSSAPAGPASPVLRQEALHVG